MRRLARVRHRRSAPNAAVVHADLPFRLVDTTAYRALRRALRPWLRRIARHEPGYRFCPVSPGDQHHAPRWPVWMEWA